MLPFVDPAPPDCRLPFKQVPGFAANGDNSLYMDVWLPQATQEAQPIAIFIHGGAFIVGSTRDVAHNQIQWLLERGVICLSIEYRLAPHAVHVEQKEDLLDAYLFITGTGLVDALSSKGHEIKVDNRRVVVTGGSAGGTCSILMALEACNHREKISPDLPLPRAIMPAFPLVSWTDDPAFSQPRSKLKEEWGHKEDWHVIEAFLNGKGATSSPYPPNVFAPDMSNPRTLFNKAGFDTKTANSFILGHDPPYPADINILDCIPPNFPPTAIWAAMNDSLIPVKQSLMLAARLEEAGLEVRVEKVAAEHGFTDLPARYFEKDAPLWWKDHIVPVMKWALTKLEA